MYWHLDTLKGFLKDVPTSDDRAAVAEGVEWPSSNQFDPQSSQKNLHP